MNKAVFLDRDGVINKEIGDYVFKKENFVINPGLMEALKTFIDNGFMLIVISNQGGIQKGLYTIDMVDELHGYLLRTLAENGIAINEIYFCPHHEVGTRCLCRKPGSMMLEKAMARFDIDASKSFFIGDKDIDVKAGTAAGLSTIRIVANTPLTSIINQVIPANSHQ